uniref:Uncharacterized protein n=1 Tax=Megaselia scalaris TaxID=36166 RepID=T1GPD7_MEGSC
MSPTSAEQSKQVLQDIKKPLKAIQGKLRVYSGDIALENLFEALDGDVKDIHRNLQIIERCVELDESGKTLVQRTSVCIMDSIGLQLLNGLGEVRKIANKFENNNLKLEINILVDDMERGILMTQDSIKSQALLQELQDLEAAKHLSEAVAKMQEFPASNEANIEEISSAKLPTEAKSLKTMCRCVLDLQKAVDVIEENVAIDNPKEQVLEEILKIMEPISKLQSAIFEALQLSPTVLFEVTASPMPQWTILNTNQLLLLPLIHLIYFLLVPRYIVLKAERLSIYLMMGPLRSSGIADSTKACKVIFSAYIVVVPSIEPSCFNSFVGISFFNFSFVDKTAFNE